jgi:hypothetical protein
MALAKILPKTNTLTQECIECQSRNSDVMFNCGHSGICWECTLLLLSKNPECHLCSKNIRFVYYIDVGYEWENVFFVSGGATVLNILKALGLEGDPINAESKPEVCEADENFRGADFGNKSSEHSDF